ncbi:hypothetical protein LG198_04790 [Methylobacillus arboreus]|uniref:hypothetical protein n=1 Tax=Methylobacillus arboreus TaxID=755170 RepID=UPI001E5F82FF|nr:hypothetical protein [Methylobacillus arboreus]MCB5190045.1 hypothetical protein [Methylobacillus arboreus]
MQFEQLKLVGGLSGGFLLFGFLCWLLLQTATMDDTPADMDFIGELCTVISTPSADTLMPCTACVALSHQLVSQKLMLGPVAFALPGISAYADHFITGEQ